MALPHWRMCTESVINSVEDVTFQPIFAIQGRQGPDRGDSDTAVCIPRFSDDCGNDFWTGKQARVGPLLSGIKLGERLLPPLARQALRQAEIRIGLRAGLAFSAIDPSQRLRRVMEKMQQGGRPNLSNPTVGALMVAGQQRSWLGRLSSVG